MELVLVLVSFAAAIGALVLTPFLSLMLAVGWANLIARHTIFFKQLRVPYRQIVITVCLYIPLLVAVCVVALLTFNQLRLWVPLSSLCIINFTPLWWLIGGAGLLVVGVQSNHPRRIRLTQGLFLFAAMCYVVSILLSLMTVSSVIPGQILSLNTDGTWLLFLNGLMACAFVAAAFTPRILMSWRRIVAIFVLIITTTLVLSLLVAQYPMPTD